MHLLINILVLSSLWCNINAQGLDETGIPLIDTLHAYVDDKNNLYFHYSGQLGQITTDLAHQFRVRPSDILSKNLYASGDTGDTSIQDQSVLIPFTAERLLKTKSATVDCIAVVYTVRPKETLFKIARRYFDLKVDRLREINNLTSNDISIDQQLVVGWYVLHPVTESVHASELTPLNTEPKNPFYPEEPTLQLGVAYWKKSQENTSHLFAMHRSARINSMIEITNPMFKTKVLVKVVGRIPPTYEQDIALVVSPAVAKRLGVLDPRFRAEMRYVE